MGRGQHRPGRCPPRRAARASHAVLSARCPQPPAWQRRDAGTRERAADPGLKRGRKRRAERERNQDGRWGEEEKEGRRGKKRETLHRGGDAEVLGRARKGRNEKKKKRKELRRLNGRRELDWGGGGAENTSGKGDKSCRGKGSGVLQRQAPEK